MKEFRVAHIVPVSHLKDTEGLQYHMCLAHLVGNEAYRKYFANMAKLGRFVLMDNGAAEGAQLQPEKLIEAYAEIHPSEIVLPDTLYESGSTIQKTRNFINKLDNRNLLGEFRLMAVPQGSTFDEWLACARIFVKDTRINTIGISKFLNICTKNRYIRYEACMELAKLIVEYKRADLEVHLLGCDEGPCVVKMIKNRFGFVRGCDSAFAYLQAQSGKMLTIEDDSRPEGTINFLDGKHYDGFVKYMENFNEFAGVKENGLSTTW